MDDSIRDLEEKLEKFISEKQFTTQNIDTIYKMSSSIVNLKRIYGKSEDSGAPVYSNNVYDKNIDYLYDSYMSAKKVYRNDSGESKKYAMLESLRRLMAELYDMIGSMLKDCECAEEKREIQVNIRKLSEL